MGLPVRADQFQLNESTGPRKAVVGMGVYYRCSETLKTLPIYWAFTDGLTSIAVIPRSLSVVHSFALLEMPSFRSECFFLNSSSSDSSNTAVQIREWMGGSLLTLTTEEIKD